MIEGSALFLLLRKRDHQFIVESFALTGSALANMDANMPDTIMSIVSFPP